MVPGILGRKLGMTQVFDEEGRPIPVTVIEAGPCVVTQIRTKERDGYTAVQLGFGEAKRLNKPMMGHLRGLGKFKYLREFRTDDISDVQVGQKVDVSIFKPGEYVDVTGTSKGRGFAGPIKRHGHSHLPMSHGSKRHRGFGSMGPTTFPGRVLKGHKMAGHYGVERVTIRNLQVVRVDPEKNLLLVKGGVPGARNGLLLIRKAKAPPR